MKIKKGDKLPDAKVFILNKDPKEVSIKQIVGDEKVILFGLPGAFTPTCSAKHLPGFVSVTDQLKEKNIQKVICISVNDPFVCLDFQKQVEHDCWKAAGSTQKVPAQRLIDFIDNKKSKDFPTSSYQPGIVSVNLNDVLPEFITSKLRQGFIDFGRKMKGFMTNEAVLHAPESRTSSPVKIPRNSETLEHISIKGLYPCAEGAGYAGGIVSAAVDGMRIIDLLAE